MHFAASQLWGRSGQKCVQAISRHAFEACTDEIDPATAKPIRDFFRRLCEGAPKVIQCLSSKPIFVFTDASYQPEGGIGGVLVEADGAPIEFFSAKLCERHLIALGAARSKQIILEAETMALIVAARLWGHLLKGRPTVFYIDNTSARDTCIANNPRTELPRRLMDLVLKAEEEFCFYAWYARLPSPSNPSDKPSREDLENYRLCGRTLKRAQCDEVLDKACAEVSCQVSRLGRGVWKNQHFLE